MISVIRRFSVTGPTAKTASFKALHVLPLKTRALTWVVSVKVIGPLYSIAVGEIPLPPGELLSPAISLREMRRSELVVEVFSPWMAKILLPGRKSLM